MHSRETLQKDGFVRLRGGYYEHNRVMERIIGRRIDLNTERVWHINLKHWDNRPENLVLLTSTERIRIMRSLHRVLRHEFGLTGENAYSQEKIKYDKEKKIYVPA